MGLELLIFIFVGSLSIFAAVMMLISDNAVHSALFLILNFATVAFMYLMLNAPFLALVQITVYAGAIMVLFLFVIMLLGAERVLPQPSAKYNWITPAAVGVVVTILLIASIAILQGEIDTTETEPHTPVIRIANSDSTLADVDVYLGEHQVAADLRFASVSDFEVVEAGEYVLTVVDHGAALDESDALLTAPLLLEDGDVFSLLLMPENVNGTRVLPVEDTLEPVAERSEARLTVVHAAACPDGCSFDIADMSRAGDAPLVFAESITYGTVTEVETIRRDRYANRNYQVGAFMAGEIEAAASGEEDTSADVQPLVEQNPFEVLDNHNYLWVITSDTRAPVLRYRTIFEETKNNPTFGSARGIGEVMFTTFMLPFELIAILLLVAMIGVIVLTKDADDKRPAARNVRRMAAVPGNPTVEAYVEAMENGTPLPPPSSAKQLPESTGD